MLKQVWYMQSGLWRFHKLNDSPFPDEKREQGRIFYQRRTMNYLSRTRRTIYTVIHLINNRFYLRYITYYTNIYYMVERCSSPSPRKSTTPKHRRRRGQYNHVLSLVGWCDGLYWRHIWQRSVSLLTYQSATPAQEIVL